MQKCWKVSIPPLSQWRTCWLGYCIVSCLYSWNSTFNLLEWWWIFVWHNGCLWPIHVFLLRRYSTKLSHSNSGVRPKWTSILHTSFGVVKVLFYLLSEGQSIIAKILPFLFLWSCQHQIKKGARETGKINGSGVFI